MKKITKKSTKKTVEPEIIMNCVTNTTPKQLYNELVEAKVRAGKPINAEELQFVKDSTTAETINEVADILAGEMAAIPHTSLEINGDEKLVFDAKGNYTIKKPNIFKRFWNWVTRKNK